MNFPSHMQVADVSNSASAMNDAVVTIFTSTLVSDIFSVISKTPITYWFSQYDISEGGGRGEGAIKQPRSQGLSTWKRGYRYSKTEQLCESGANQPVANPSTKMWQSRYKDQTDE